MGCRLPLGVLAAWSLAAQDGRDRPVDPPESGKGVLPYVSGWSWYAARVTASPSDERSDRVSAFGRHVRCARRG